RGWVGVRGITMTTRRTHFMNLRWLVSLLACLIAGLGSSALAGPPQFPQDATFTTLITTPRPIEGLTGDNSGNLYVGGSSVLITLPPPCPIWQINLHNPALQVVAN